MGMLLPEKIGIDVGQAQPGGVEYKLKTCSPSLHALSSREAYTLSNLSFFGTISEIFSKAYI
jgi:hypothetical protein